MATAPVSDAELEVIKRLASAADEDFENLDASMFRKYLLQVRLQTRIADQMAEDRFQAWLEKQN